MMTRLTAQNTEHDNHFDELTCAMNVTEDGSKHLPPSESKPTETAADDVDWKAVMADVDALKPLRNRLKLNDGSGKSSHGSINAQKNSKALIKPAYHHTSRPCLDSRKHTATTSLAQSHSPSDVLHTCIPNWTLHPASRTWKHSSVRTSPVHRPP